jgi:hypothetical protein
LLDTPSDDHQDLEIAAAGIHPITLGSNDSLPKKDGGMIPCNDIHTYNINLNYA